MRVIFNVGVYRENSTERCKLDKNVNLPEKMA